MDFFMKINRDVCCLFIKYIAINKMYVGLTFNSLITVTIGILAAGYFWRYPSPQKAVRRPPNPEKPLPPSDSPLFRFSRAAVCSDNNVCSLLSKSAMEKGGSAVDGALVALFCTGLIGMQSMGLGGGMLMNIYSDKARKSYSILAREIAPRLLREKNLSIFRGEKEFKQSSWSIAVPAEMAGYAIAHQKFGQLPWSELVGPTAELCRKGYRLYKHQYDALVMNQEMVMRDPGLRNMFVNSESGQFWRIGSHIHPPIQLCNTYERLASEGPYSFYNGSIANDLTADLREIGSVIDMEDLVNTNATFSESVVIPFDEYDLHLTPPPGSGYILGFILNILREFRADFAEARSIGALEIHRMVEAMKFGFVQRWQLDEKSDINLLKRLISPELSKSIANKIDDLMTFNQSTYYGASSDIRTRNEYGTAHISVLLDNDAVSVTSSINFYN
ncbi:glutathione hydrolase 1 proenzyme-like isoform X2 [Drosophila ananassae]|uniref:glutathione hydrolase 1 proenzyme isoform X2 n=1 Tax=Drosophila ananassae TaxID=7217 RepID=UPI001CFFA8C7|nr:glutathione hydrolase 1 proenzyme isoform X2 [Drosophila ananassae]XP_044573205.1 glutathione hydrolase 1 proenzyme-like isoform X2 [Drosophila ananassae]